MRLNATRLGSIASSRSFGDQLLDLAGQTSPLDLQFAATKTLDPRVTFTRASTGTFVGANGTIQTAAVDAPRFDHNPTTGESLGLLVEEARTNLLLNSATLSTQSVTVAAVANTLSFYGTGTVTLTGVSTAGPLVGTGANNRVSLTFTPTAGSLTLTVSGSVTNAQLEAGAFPTSYIPTTSATVTRAADVASITGTNFSSWYKQTEGTVFAEVAASANSFACYAAISNGTLGQNSIFLDNDSSGIMRSIAFSGSSLVALLSLGGIGTVGVLNRLSSTYKLNDFAAARNGGTVQTDTSGAVPVSVTQLDIGRNPSAVASGYLSGTIKRLTYWPVRLANTTLQQITQP
jgi:hypothetical protein